MHAQREAWSLVPLRDSLIKKRQRVNSPHNPTTPIVYKGNVSYALMWPGHSPFFKRYLFSSVLIRWQVLSWRSSTKDLSRHQEFQKNCHTMFLETAAGWGDHIDRWSVSQAALEVQHRITTGLNKIWIIQSRKQREDISPIPSATFLPCTLKIKVNLTLAR